MQSTSQSNWQYNEYFGKNLKQRREAKGIGEQELAQKAEVNLITLRRIESGKQVPRRSTIQKLRRALGDEAQIHPYPGLREVALEEKLTLNEVERVWQATLKPQEKRSPEEWRTLQKVLKEHPELFTTEELT